MANLFGFLVVAAAVAVLAWNFIPAVRERMRGWTTTLEAAFLAGFPIASELVDAFKSDQVFWSGYIPEPAWKYTVVAMAVWFLFKRVVTNTAIGNP